MLNCRASYNLYCSCTGTCSLGLYSNYCSSTSGKAYMSTDVSLRVVSPYIPTHVPVRAFLAYAPTIVNELVLQAYNPNCSTGTCSLGISSNWCSEWYVQSWIILQLLY